MTSTSLRMTLLAGLLLACAGSTAAHDPAKPASKAEDDRYQLVRYRAGEVAEVVDRLRGRVYSMDLRGGVCAVLDVAQGTIVTRGLVEEVVKREAGPPPTWPVTESGSKGARYTRLGLSGSVAVVLGGPLALFDHETARIRIWSATSAQLVTLDPLAGKRIRYALHVKDGAGRLQQLARGRQEAVAREALRNVHRAQVSHYRDNGAYGDLAALQAQKLIHPALDTPGYRIEVAVSKAAPDRRFLLVATPVRKGYRSYAMTERGRVYESTVPIPLKVEANLPKGVRLWVNPKRKPRPKVTVGPRK